MFDSTRRVYILPQKRCMKYRFAKYSCYRRQWRYLRIALCLCVKGIRIKYLSEARRESHVTIRTAALKKLQISQRESESTYFQAMWISIVSYYNNLVRLTTLIIFADF